LNHSKTYRAIAVFLTFLILFSSLSYKIEKHICEGEVLTSFFDVAENLCDVETASCHSDSKTNCCTVSEEEANCCWNTSEFIRGINLEQQAQTEQKLSVAPILFLFSDFFTTKLQSLQALPQKFLFIKYSPKLPDLGILFQVFRI